MKLVVLFLLFSSSLGRIEQNACDLVCKSLFRGPEWTFHDVGGVDEVNTVKPLHREHPRAFSCGGYTLARVEI